MSENQDWEKVDDTTERKKVPNGWLYKTWTMKHYYKEWGIFPFNGTTEGFYKDNIQTTFVPE